MGASTTNLAVPYAVSTDTPDVPRDTLALANRLDAILSTSPVKATTSTSWVASTTDFTVQSITLGVGKWTVHAKGYFDFSNASATAYQSQLYDGTSVLDVVLIGNGPLVLRTGYAHLTTVTVASGTKTISMQLRASSVNGSQSAGGFVMVAEPVYYYNGTW